MSTIAGGAAGVAPSRRSIWNRQLAHYPDTARRTLYLGITVAATVVLYYELYVQGSVATKIIQDFGFTFTQFVFVLVIGNVWVAFALAAIVFGLAHLYQGLVGVVATTAVGVLLTAFYLASGSIWIAVLVHGAIDLVGLVLRPLLDGTVRRAEAGA